jgi:putative peptidoglycan lipid II flippase
MDRLKVVVNNLFDKSDVYRDIALVVLTVFIVKILGFFKEVLIGNSFGMTEELDVFFILILIPSFFSSVFLGAFKAVLIPNYIFAKKKSNTVFHNNLIVQTILLSLALTIGLYFLSAPINTYLVRNYSQEFANQVFTNQNLFLLCIPVWTFSSLLSGLLDIKKRFVISALYPIITSIVFIVLLFFYKPSVHILVYAFVLGSFFELLFLLCFQPVKLVLSDVKFNDSDSIILYKQFLPKLLAGVIIGFNPIVDQLFTSQLTDGAISTLNYGNKLPAFAIAILTIGIGNVLLPYFAHLKDTPKGEILILLNKKFKAIFIIGAFCALFLIVFGKDLIILFFQNGAFTINDSENVSSVLIMFSLQIPFYLLDIILVRLLTAFNLNVFNITSSSISVLLNVFCNYIFIEKYGVAGIALSTSIVVFISFLTKYIYILRKFKTDKTVML